MTERYAPDIGEWSKGSVRLSLLVTLVPTESPKARFGNHQGVYVSRLPLDIAVGSPERSLPNDFDWAAVESIAASVSSTDRESQ